MGPLLTNHPLPKTSSCSRRFIFSRNAFFSRYLCSFMGKYVNNVIPKLVWRSGILLVGRSGTSNCVVSPSCCSALAESLIAAIHAIRLVTVFTDGQTCIKCPKQSTHILHFQLSAIKYHHFIVWTFRYLSSHL